MPPSAKALAEAAHKYVLHHYGDQKNPLRVVVCFAPSLEFDCVHVELAPRTVGTSCDPTEMHSNILEALAGGVKLTGPKLAERAGYTYSGRFRAALSSLVKSGEVLNHRPGYSLAE